MPTPRLSTRGIVRLNEISAKAAQDPNLPPFVFGVSNTEGELYFTSQGRLDHHDPSSAPLTPSSTFWICSMTKLIASIATLQLVDKGFLTLDTPVSKFIPAFANPVVLQYPYKVARPSYAPAKGEVTVLHLLNHSSGLHYSLTMPDPVYLLPAAYTARHAKGEGVEGFLKVIQKDYPGIPLKFEPGTNWTYGYSSDILGFLVEAVTGLSFEQYCQENIFQPLNLTASFHLTPDLRENLVKLKFRNEDGTIVPWADQTPLTEQDPENVHTYLGGIGVYTSMRDYLSLLRNLLQVKAGTPPPNPLLSKHSTDSLFTPTLTPAGAASLVRFNMTDPALQFSTGLALNERDTPGMRRAGSGWWAGWAGTSFFLDPTTGVAVVFGTQLVPPGDLQVEKFKAKLEKALYTGLEEGGRTEASPSSKL